MDGEPETPATASGAVAESVIDRFGGIRPMATKLAVPVTTVQGWKKRGIIPQLRHADILAAAARENITINPVELAATDPGPVARPEIRPLAEPVPLAAPEPVISQPAASKPVASGPIIVRKNGAVAYIALVLALIVGLAGVGAGFLGWRYYLEPLRAKVAALEARPSAGNNDDLVRRIAKLEGQSAVPRPGRRHAGSQRDTGRPAGRVGAAIG
jgi:hypothetical protein